VNAKHCLRCGHPLGPFHDGERERLRCTAEGCGWIYYGNPTPVVAALVEHEGEIVLVHQPGWPPKFFALVAGFLEAGESPEAGVLRELREELNVDGEVVSLIGVYAFEMRNELILAYHVRARGEPRLGPELDGMKRLPPDQLRPWPVGTGLAVRDWLDRRAKGTTT
jgi:NADH pyrophosphatase NudC (nudix superfamily)